MRVSPHFFHVALCSRGSLDKATACCCAAVGVLRTPCPVATPVADAVVQQHVTHRSSSSLFECNSAAPQVGAAELMRRFSSRAPVPLAARTGALPLCHLPTSIGAKELSFTVV